MPAAAAAALLLLSPLLRAGDWELPAFKADAGAQTGSVKKSKRGCAPGYDRKPERLCPSKDYPGELFGHDDLALAGGLAGCSAADSVFKRIYRGGAPSRNGLACLKQKLGVGAVFDLRAEGGSTEKKRAEALGLAYFRFPMGMDGRTKGCGKKKSAQAARNEEAVKAAAQALTDFLKANPDANAFVHCAVGQDRTGLMLGVYRLIADQCADKELVRCEMADYWYTPYCDLDEVWEAWKAP